MNRLVLINVSIGLILVWQVNNNMETLTKSTLVQFFNFLSNVILLRNSHNDQLSLPLYTLILYIMVFFKSAFFNHIILNVFYIFKTYDKHVLFPIFFIITNRYVLIPQIYNKIIKNPLLIYLCSVCNRISSAGTLILIVLNLKDQQAIFFALVAANCKPLIVISSLVDQDMHYMQAIWKLRFNILRGTVVHISALWLSQYYDDEENKKKVILVVFIVLETIFKIMGKRK